MKPRLVVALPLVWGVRNVIRSGLAEQLGREFRLIYAIPAEAREGLTSEGIPESDTWILEKPAADRRTERVLRLLRSAHVLRHPTASDVLIAWNKGSRLRLRRELRDLAFRTAASFARSDKAFSRLERTEERLFTKTISPRVWEFLRKTGPVAGLSTSCVMDWERPLFQAMSVSGIPTATHILSFDNLTSHGYLPLRQFSAYFVWQETMASELMRFFGVERGKVTITGTPQFDFNVRPEFRWSGSKTVTTLGLRANQPYFVYCANHVKITPTEPSLVADILTATSQDPRFRNHQWVLRLHPMDAYNRWADLERRFPTVVISRPWKHGSESRFWAIPSADEVALLGNTLRYADAMLTIASTTALDSAVVDTPVVCVGFHPSAPPAESRFYYDAHYSHHYRAVMESGATPIATRMDSLRALLAAAVNDRGGLRKERASLVRRLCGTVDGNAVERIARGMKELAAGCVSDIAISHRRAGVAQA